MMMMNSYTCSTQQQQQSLQQQQFPLQLQQQQSLQPLQRFPLFKLPDKSINCTLRLFHCLDLLDFSKCSKRCKRMIRELNHNIDGIELSLMENNNMIMLKTGLQIRGFIDFDATILMEHCFLLRYFNGIGGIMVAKVDDFYHCRNVYPVDPGRVLQSITDYLIEIFMAPLHISLIPNGIEFNRFLHGIKKCETMTIAGTTTISNWNLKYALENVKANGRLTLNIRPYPNFYCSDPPLFIDTDELEMLETAEWMTRSIFLKLYCMRVRLSFCHLKAQDIEDFVLQWYLSNNTRLEYVEVWFKISPGQMLFRNAKPLPWDPYRRAQYYNTTPFIALNCANGWDIIRSDGMIATVLVTSGSFHFIVWKDRFPPITGAIIDLY